MNNSTNLHKYGSTSILYKTRDRIATITINRPKKRNVLGMQEFDSVIKYVNEADNEFNVHDIRIRSTGDRAFSGGLDLNML